MFKDILGPRHDPDNDVKEDHGPFDDDTRKEEVLSNHPCTWDCECDDCLDDAIKELADEIGFDLEGEDIENIKIEYHNGIYGNFGCLLTKYGKLTIAVKKIKGDEIKKIIERGEWK